MVRGIHFRCLSVKCFFFTLHLYRRWVHSHSFPVLMCLCFCFRGYYVHKCSSFAGMHDLLYNIYFFRIGFFGECRMTISHDGYRVCTLDCAPSLICLSELPHFQILICKHMHIPNQNRKI